MSLPQGAWSKLQREAGNPFNVLKAANTDRRHTAGIQSPEKGRPGIGPVPGGQEAQGSWTRAAAGEGQERAGQNRQLEQKERRQPGELQAPYPTTSSNNNKAHPSLRSRVPTRQAHQQQGPRSPPNRSRKPVGGVHSSHHSHPPPENQGPLTHERKNPMIPTHAMT